ncbi:hypothetical protein [Pelagibius sp.]|uniref:hypothetical protein n=1 Tax=Pelagibius sp. TaxID=1931238 RepID=UPI00260547FA|nr:hypothetical protein [Pelagibius sp.]
MTDRINRTALSDLENHLIPLEGAASVLADWIGDMHVGSEDADREYTQLRTAGICWLAWEIFHETVKVRECFERLWTADKSDRTAA